ncbi:hypothetical protein [Pectobacterium peruviense]|uniref:hypothetical protein n=1 Tax=Pectobacterium peruviense TaxID=2066479 RepID=UPI0012FEDBDE|nr:hypothetical protein [Pectobacterium peruviense]
MTENLLDIASIPAAKGASADFDKIRQKVGENISGKTTRRKAPCFSALLRMTWRN